MTAQNPSSQPGEFTAPVFPSQAGSTAGLLPPASRDETPQRWEVLADEAGYRPAALARLCGVSLRTLQRHFAERYQLTVRQWLRRVRLQQAYAGLAEGQRIKEVAYGLHYKQLSHFSRDFKNFHGVPPRHFEADRAVKRLERIGFAGFAASKGRPHSARPHSI